MSISRVRSVTVISTTFMIPIPLASEIDHVIELSVAMTLGQQLPDLGCNLRHEFHAFCRNIHLIDCGRRLEIAYDGNWNQRLSDTSVVP